jgi:hypothetical protein
MARVCRKRYTRERDGACPSCGKREWVGIGGGARLAPVLGCAAQGVLSLDGKQAAARAGPGPPSLLTQPTLWLLLPLPPKGYKGPYPVNPDPWPQARWRRRRTWRRA